MRGAAMDTAKKPAAEPTPVLRDPMAAAPYSPL